VPVYIAAFANIKLRLPTGDGQAELTWVAGYIRKWFTRRSTVTHPGTNRAQRSLTLLMRPMALQTKRNRHLVVYQLWKIC